MRTLLFVLLLVVLCTYQLLVKSGDLTSIDRLLRLRPDRLEYEQKFVSLFLPLSPQKRYPIPARNMSLSRLLVVVTRCHVARSIQCSVNRILLDKDTNQSSFVTLFGPLES